jgi:hypothetical protein
MIPIREQNYLEQKLSFAGPRTVRCGVRRESSIDMLSFGLCHPSRASREVLFGPVEEEDDGTTPCPFVTGSSSYLSY